MLDILQFRNYLEHLKETVDGINSVHLAIDDSQIADFVKDMKQSDNLVLVGIIPSHQAQAADEHSLMNKDLVALLVLRKADRKLRHNEFIEALHSCQLAAKAIELQLLHDMYSYNGGCSFLQMLEPGSINIDPLYALAGTDGYEINFSLRSHLL